MITVKQGAFFTTDFAKSFDNYPMVISNIFYVHFAARLEFRKLWSSFICECDSEKAKVYLLLAGMIMVSTFGPVVSAKSQPAYDNDSSYSRPAGTANMGSGEVELPPDEKRKKYRERITISKPPGARYERIIINPPPAPVARPLPKPAIMPEAARPSGGDKRWQKYDEMTISPNENTSPDALFLLPPN